MAAAYPLAAIKVAVPRQSSPTFRNSILHHIRLGQSCRRSAQDAEDQFVPGSCRTSPLSFSEKG